MFYALFSDSFVSYFWYNLKYVFCMCIFLKKIKENVKTIENSIYCKF